jgi:hypothetical protein
VIDDKCFGTSSVSFSFAFIAQDIFFFFAFSGRYSSGKRFGTQLVGTILRSKCYIIEPALI